MLPILYQSPEFILYSYPLLMGLGWGVSYQVFFSLLGPSVTRLKGQILFWGIFLFAYVGAKLFFIITYPGSSQILKNLSFWTGGGFVFYGGLLGGVFYLTLYKLFNKNCDLNTLWPILPALALGHGIGRIGCFLAGCCFGRPTNKLWGIFLHGHFRHPTQLIEALGLLILGLYLIKSSRSRLHLLVTYLVGYGILRIVGENLRGDIIRGSWGSFTPSLWISLILVMSGLSIKIIVTLSSFLKNQRC